MGIDILNKKVYFYFLVNFTKFNILTRFFFVKLNKKADYSTNHHFTSINFKLSLPIDNMPFLISFN